MAAAANVKAGDVLGGKYRVERVLGTGGMGMVVLARHTELGQRVAVKLMLKDALVDPANAERFAREARAAVRLQSAHTARVLDVGKLKNGEPYMVMEYLDGHDLDEVLRRTGPMAPPVAVDYMLQACEAFAEAHSLGMIHRDIKPKNLFLAKALDGHDVVKVLDFGLAKTIGGVGGDISLTATSAVFGSPQYMSPEQMRSAKDVDTRSDIWSIGVCLYELLTGRVPFDATGLAEICAMVLKDTVEPPSRWAVGLPPELDDVVVKCLAKDPKNRYQTVADLAFALEPWSKIEGSARRILHVMQTVQKAEVPTIVNVDVNAEDQAKTMDAWGTGDRAKAQGSRVPKLAYVLGGFAALTFVGVVAGAASFATGRTASSPVSGGVAVPIAVEPAVVATTAASASTTTTVAESPPDPLPTTPLTAAAPPTPPPPAVTAPASKPAPRTAPPIMKPTPPPPPRTPKPPPATTRPSAKDTF